MKRLALFFAIGALFLGFWAGGEKAVAKKIAEGIHPEKEFPLIENKPFVAIVYAHNDAPWCERSLRSLFEQEYASFRVIFIDDASRDGTYEKARSYILENQQDHRVILVRNEERLGLVACLYRALDSLFDRDIALPLFARDWLAHPHAVERLNAAYQNPDVWLTASPHLAYPSYEIVSEEKLPSSFYTALFRQIPLADLFREGQFAEKRESYLVPLTEMAGGRIRPLTDPLTFRNTSSQWERGGGEKFFRSYTPLAEFPRAAKKRERADCLLFSFNRPLQLFACLESIERYFSGWEKITVLYRASDERFSAAYEEVKRAFPAVAFVRQSEDPKRDFKPLVLKHLFQSPSEYILFGVDDIIAKDFVDLDLCMEMMRRTGAYGFYLRFGKNIQFCYQTGSPQPLPLNVPLGKNVYAWDIKRGQMDWGFPNTLDMTLFRKKDLKKAFEKMQFKTPNSLEFIWANEHAPSQAIGLYFEQSKIVNLPLNVVSPTGNPHMNFASAEELLAQFEKGMKIEIDPLFQIENASPHFEYTPGFTQR